MRKQGSAIDDQTCQAPADGDDDPAVQSCLSRDDASGLPPGEDQNDQPDQMLQLRGENGPEPRPDSHSSIRPKTWLLIRETLREACADHRKGCEDATHNP